MSRFQNNLSTTASYAYWTGANEVSKLLILATVIDVLAISKGMWFSTFLNDYIPPLESFHCRNWQIWDKKLFQSNKNNDMLDWPCGRVFDMMEAETLLIVIEKSLDVADYLFHCPNA